MSEQARDYGQHRAYQAVYGGAVACAACDVPWPCYEALRAELATARAAFSEAIREAAQWRDKAERAEECIEGWNDTGHQLVRQRGSERARRRRAVRWAWKWRREARVERQNTATMEEERSGWYDQYVAAKARADAAEAELAALREVHLHGCECAPDDACGFARERDIAKRECDRLAGEVARLREALEATAGFLSRRFNYEVHMNGETCLCLGCQARRLLGKIRSVLAPQPQPEKGGN